ncbi:MAG: DUF2868 domain-containing protein [Ketobacter sp.]
MKNNPDLRWTFSKIMQFEGYRLRDQGQPETALEERDRTLYQKAPLRPSGPREAYAYWVEQRLTQDPIEPDPGKLFSASYGVAVFIMLLTGLISGASITYAALYYDGSVPVNVALFLGVVVLPQLVMLFFLLLTLLLAFAGSAVFAGWYAVPIRLGTWLLQALWGKFGHHIALATENKDDLQSSKRALAEAVEHHRGLFGNRVFRLFQHAGMAFNVGALLCLAALLAFTDRAFGWQSSLTDSAATIHTIVSALALPWSGLFGEGVGYPDLQQIIGSRIVLRESGEALHSYDLLSWWPFLALSVVLYGLVPRLIAWLVSVILESRLLGSLDFSGYHYQSLWRRMLSIELRSAGRPSLHSPESNKPLRETPAPNGTPQEVFVLRESQSRYQDEYLDKWLKQISGFQGHFKTVADVRACATATQGEADVFLVIEGWQPPIEEKLAALTDCADLLQQNKQRLHLLLLGKPTPTGSAPMTDRLTEVWRKKLEQTETSLYVHTDAVDVGRTGT